MRKLSAVIVGIPAALIVYAGWSRRWLDDDGFIYLRIARNWIEGHGPVFNVGERVEAATSPLWLSIVTLLGFLGLPLEHVAVFAGIALTGVGMLFAELGAWRLHRKIDGELSATRAARTVPLPIGALIYVALPPAWDYASSGLDTGLAIGWLSASFWMLACYVEPLPPTMEIVSKLTISARDARFSSLRLALSAALVGLGPLVRPELAAVSPPLMLLLAWAAGSRAPGERSTRLLPRLALVGACASLLPFAYEVFRMGYFGSLAPNPSLAKEAFAPRFDQGACYFRNFFGLYRVGWPLLCAGAFFVALATRHAKAGRWLALATTVAPSLMGAMLTGYVVAMGGDYMHGRMFLVPIFTALLPVAAVPIAVPGRGTLSLQGGAPVRLSLGAAATAAIAWALICASSIRVAVENVCDIGDERGWYSREAKRNHPTEIAAFKEHSFYREGSGLLDRIRAACPSLSARSPGLGCRQAYLRDTDQTQIGPTQEAFPLARSVDASVMAVASAGAIGIIGYLLPDTAHLVDVLGLADPIGARLQLVSRGRPGHEKNLPIAWTLARFTAVDEREDSAVHAARHAMHCGLLANLERAVSGELTARTFLDNMEHARALYGLRVPSDPFEAEELFCHTPPLEQAITSATGGTPFRWRCPSGVPFAQIKGDMDAAGSLVRIHVVCGDNEAEGGPREPIEGPAFGGSDPAKASFAVACPSGSVVAGLFGTSEGTVRSVGLLCSGGSNGVLRSSAGGTPVGTPFALSCHEGSVVVGIKGRAGDLLDATGILCEPAPPGDKG